MHMHRLEAFSPEPCLEHTYITKQFFSNDILADDY